MDCLAWGCLGAFALASKRAWIEDVAGKRSDICFSICFALILIPYLVKLGQGFQELGFIGLLLHSVVCPQWFIYRILNWEWMKKIGILSYSIYLWQQFLWFLWPAPLAKLWLWIPTAIGIAWLSYEFLEKPFFSLLAKFREAETANNRIALET